MSIAGGQLGEGALEFISDISHRETHVLHRGFQIGVSHHLLQDRQADAGARHISAEGVSKTMRIRHGQRRTSPPVAEQTAESGHCHRSPTMLALKHYEKSLFGAIARPFQLLVLLNDLGEDIGQRKSAVALAFSAHADAGVTEDDVPDIEPKRFSRAQSAEQHEVNDRQISVTCDAAQERAHLLWRERLHEFARLCDSELARAATA
jgi:hypothetical protein